MPSSARHSTHTFVTWMVRRVVHNDVRLAGDVFGLIDRQSRAFGDLHFPVAASA
jgi:hypothetical protein